MDLHSEDIAEHAKKVLKAIDAYEERYPRHAPAKGISNHLAQFAKLCDDCGNTYWSRDEYGMHIGCKGFVQKKTGF